MIKIGDIVRDINRNWPKFQCTGVVTSINGDYVTWQDDKTGEMVTDHYQDLEIVYQDGGRIFIPGQGNVEVDMGNRLDCPTNGISGCDNYSNLSDMMDCRDKCTNEFYIKVNEINDPSGDSTGVPTTDENGMRLIRSTRQPNINNYN